MKTSIFLTVFALSIAALLNFNSCNKDKNHSTVLMNGNWNVVELTVNDVQLVSELPNLKIYRGDIYSEVLEGDWISSGTSKFYWQFSDKGKHFNIARMHEICNSESTTEASQQVYNYSGKYKVLKQNKNEFIFESKETLGFAGDKVKLRITKW